MSTEPEPTYVAVTVTCATDGCENAGVAITLTMPDTAGAAVVCGVCGADLGPSVRRS